MEELSDRIHQALANEDARAERFAGNVRLILLVFLTLVALLNIPSVSSRASAFNFIALGIGYSYGSIILLRIRHKGYRAPLKYVTSCLDVILVFLLLFMYTRIEIPSVALKHYVFLVNFPLIALTAFRYDRRLALTAGGLATVLYVGLILSLYLSGSITITHGGYYQELFSGDITYVGQLTKVLILAGYVILLAYHAQYSRRIFIKLISNELSLRNQKESMDWEMKIASRVQTQFLPQFFPVIPGLDLYGSVRQGRFVGGDYYDFIRLADDTLLVISADVSGKGVPAALIMAQVRASTQLLASTRISLEDLVCRLNTLIHHSTDKKNFVTFFAGEIDISQQRLTYVNAGHPPPFVYSSREIRQLGKGTLPLGLYNSLPQLVQHSEEFHPGDIFVSYTDGIVEQTNLKGDQFGKERLINCVNSMKHLNAQDLTLKLFEEVGNFGEGKAPEDDAALAVVKYR